MFVSRGVEDLVPKNVANGMDLMLDVRLDVACSCWRDF